METKNQRHDRVHVSGVNSRENGADDYSNTKMAGTEKNEIFLSHVALELKAASMKKYKGSGFQHKDQFQDRALEIQVHDSSAQTWKLKLGYLTKLPRSQMLRKCYSIKVFQE